MTGKTPSMMIIKSDKDFDDVHVFRNRYVSTGVNENKLVNFGCDTVL